MDYVTSNVASRSGELPNTSKTIRNCWRVSLTASMADASSEPSSSTFAPGTSTAHNTSNHDSPKKTSRQWSRSTNGESASLKPRFSGYGNPTIDSTILRGTLTCRAWRRRSTTVTFLYSQGHCCRVSAKWRCTMDTQRSKFFQRDSEHFDGGSSVDGWLAGQQRQERRANAINVGADIQFPAEKLFGRCVGRNGRATVRPNGDLASNAVGLITRMCPGHRLVRQRSRPPKC